MSKYPTVSCSQCGQSFGPGDSGYSACKEHRLSRDRAAAQRASTAAQAAAKASNATGPLNGIAANWFHDEGAIARCSFCKRYTLDRNALHDWDSRRTVCTCGSIHGWSGSFAKPGPDAIWHGTPPSIPAPQGEHP